MINRETGSVLLADAWCGKGNSRIDIEARLKSFSWVRVLKHKNDLFCDDFFLHVKERDIYAMLIFRQDGLACVKFGLKSIFKIRGFKRQVEAYNAFLLEKCGLTPGKYSWGHLRVNGDFRDGASEIDVVYD